VILRQLVGTCSGVGLMRGGEKACGQADAIGGASRLAHEQEVRDHYLAGFPGRDPAAAGG
jgi:hypothetical protein